MRPRALGLVRRPRIGIAVAAAAGLWLLAEVVAHLQETVVGPNPQLLTLIDASHPSLTNLAIEVVVEGGFVGFAEELFFRAVLFAALRQRMPFVAAAALSSAIFAATHGLGAFVPIFVVGFGLAALYERRNSLWTNALAHATFNTISAVAIYLVATRG